MSLEAYCSKGFADTPAPRARSGAVGRRKYPRHAQGFIHKDDANPLHYDFRLAMRVLLVHQ